MAVNTVFLSDKERDKVVVGFPRSSFYEHQGAGGLKYYLIVMYLRKHASIFGEVILCLSDLMAECGYSTKTHSYKIYEDFRNILEQLQRQEYLSLSISVQKISPNTYFKVQLSIEKNLFATNEAYVAFTNEEFEKIVSAKTSVKKAVLAGVYLYVKQFVPISSYTVKISYPSKQTLSKGVGAAKSSIENALAVLEHEELLYCGKPLFAEDNNRKGAYIQMRNYYALSPEDLDEDNCIRELEAHYNKKLYFQDELPHNALITYL